MVITKECLDVYKLRFFFENLKFTIVPYKEAKNFIWKTSECRKIILKTNECREKWIASRN